MKKGTFIELADDLEGVIRGQISESHIRNKYQTKDDREVAAILANLEHFLSDSDLRNKDHRYKQMQETEMQKLIRALRNGDFERASKISFLEES